MSTYPNIDIWIIWALGHISYLRGKLDGTFKDICRSQMLQQNARRPFPCTLRASNYGDSEQSVLFLWNESKWSPPSPQSLGAECSSSASDSQLLQAAPNFFIFAAANYLCHTASRVTAPTHKQCQCQGRDHIHSTPRSRKPRPRSALGARTNNCLLLVNMFSAGRGKCFSTNALVHDSRSPASHNWMPRDAASDLRDGAR